MDRSRLTQASKKALIQTRNYQNIASQRKIHCSGCQNWSAKMKELTWSYEQLLQSKQEEIKSLNRVIQKLDLQTLEQSKRSEAHYNRLQQIQIEYESQKHKLLQQERVIQYFKEREVELLSQLKQVEDELYMKSVQVRDDKDEKDEKILDKYTQNSQNQAKTKMNNQLLPVLNYQINHSESLNRMLNKNVIQLQKIKQDKLVLELKHRMALLRAVQFSVLK